MTTDGAPSPEAPAAAGPRRGSEVRAVVARPRCRPPASTTAWPGPWLAAPGIWLPSAAAALVASRMRSTALALSASVTSTSSRTRTSCGFAPPRAARPAASTHTSIVRASPAATREFLTLFNVLHHAKLPTCSHTASRASMLMRKPSGLSGLRSALSAAQARSRGVPLLEVAHSAARSAASGTRAAHFISSALCFPAPRRTEKYLTAFRPSISSDRLVTRPSPSCACACRSHSAGTPKARTRSL